MVLESVVAAARTEAQKASTVGDFTLLALEEAQEQDEFVSKRQRFKAVMEVRKDVGAGAEEALKGKKSGQDRDDGRKGAGRGAYGGYQSGVVCYTCGRPGHYSRSCRVGPNTQMRGMPMGAQMAAQGGGPQMPAGRGGGSALALPAPNQP